MQRCIGLLILIVLVSASINVPSADAEEANEMDVHFIDVGQGDSMLIQTPEGKNILIDAGPPKSGKNVTAFLKKHQVSQLDLVIATHPDIDHIGGMAAVIKTFEIKKIMDIGKIHSTKTYAKYASQILKQQIPLTIAEKNELIKLDPYLKIRVLNAYEGPQRNNAASIVLKLSFKDTDFLLMGDVGKDQEKRLMNNYNLDSDIIKVAHHGSRTSTSRKFLQEVSPDMAILTYGEENKYGHPVDRVMTNLQDVDTAMYPTAMFGNITIRTNGESVMIFQEKMPTDYLKAN
ncbi:ComEC/Rec2 family competence protein [Lentibacillus kimchii]|uniref:ComEC/Rec2 family competence protein n=1 Tax=Lentibacillus kimchii TaxID=1542911 RepID=A0ABW2UTK8_9BACI